MQPLVLKETDNQDACDRANVRNQSGSHWRKIVNRCEQHGFETTTRKVRKVSKVQGVQGVQGLSLSPRFAGLPNVSSLSEPF